MKDKTINMKYYRSRLIKHVWGIRLSRVSQSKAIYKIAQILPAAAQEYANYQANEMPNDKLYIRDCEPSGVSPEKITNTEPYLSIKLFEGYFYYTLEHEHPMAPVVWNYLVEYTQPKLQPDIAKNPKFTLEHEVTKGQETNSSSIRATTTRWKSVIFSISLFSARTTATPCSSTSMTFIKFWQCFSERSMKTQC